MAKTLLSKLHLELLIQFYNFNPLVISSVLLNFVVYLFQEGPLVEEIIQRYSFFTSLIKDFLDIFKYI